MAPQFTISIQLADGSEQTVSFAKNRGIVGSDKECDIAVSGEGVAARHIELWFGTNKLEVEDLGSGGVSLLNGAVFTGRMDSVYPATVQVGRVVLSIRQETEPEFVEPLDPPFESVSGETMVFGMNSIDGETDHVAPVQFVYQLKEQIAKGGMGKIFTGEDPLLAREVAVKVSSVQRTGEACQLTEEAQVLARLVHPNIVPVYAIGVNARGAVFYSMKLVKGRTLQNVIEHLASGEPKTVRLYTRERLLTVFRKVCDAIGYAHANRFIHRDLKPENLMIGEYGEVMVMDWGLAQPIRKESESHEQVHVIEGTPQYMSPEQARGKHLDERSDIYTLGGILYAILLLRAPISGKTIPEVIQKVMKGELTPMGHSGSGESDPRSASREVPEALQAVILKAMALDRTQRYPSVEDLVSDIESYQNGFATSAEHAGIGRLLALLVKRNKGVAVMVGLLFSAGVWFTVKLAESERIARDERQVAVEQRQLAEANEQKALANEKLAEANGKRALEEKETSRRAAAGAQIALANSANLALNESLMRKALLDVPEDLRDDTWSYLNRKLDTSLTLPAKGGVPFTAVISHPTKAGLFVTAQEDGWIRLLDVRAGEIIDLFHLDAGKKERKIPAVWVLAVSPDAERLAVAFPRSVSGEWEAAQPTAIYRIRDGVKLTELSDKRGVRSLSFSPNGTLLVSSFFRGIQVWDAGTSQVQWTNMESLAGSNPQHSRGLFSGDGRGLRTFQNEKLIEFDSEKGTLLRTFPGVPTPDWFCSEPGWEHVFIGLSGVLRKYRVTDGQMLFENRINSGVVFGTGLAPKSRSLITASRSPDGTGLLQLWDNKVGYLQRSEYCWGDGGHIAVQSVSGEVVQPRGAEVRVWHMEIFEPKLELKSNRASRGDLCQFLGDPWRFVRRLNTPNDRWDLQVLDLRKKNFHSAPSFIVPNQERLSQCFASAGGEVIGLAGGADKKTVNVWRREGETYTQWSSWKSDIEVEAVCVSPTGDRLWTGRGIYEMLGGKRLAGVETADLSGKLGHAELLWNEKRLCGKVLFKSLGGASTLGIAVWDSESGRRIASAETPDVRTIGATRDGSLLAEGGTDYRIRVRNGETLKVERDFRAHDGVVSGVAWHPSLPLLVSVSEDLTMKIWDTRSWQCVEEIRGLPSAPEVLSLSADGSALSVYFNQSKKTRIYEPETFRR